MQLQYFLSITSIVLIGSIFAVEQKSSIPQELVGTWRILELRDDNLDQNGRLSLPKIGTVLADSKAMLKIAVDGTTVVTCNRGMHLTGPHMSWVSFSKMMPADDGNKAHLDIESHVEHKDGTKVLHPAIWSISESRLTIVWREEAATKNSPRPTKLVSDGVNNLFLCERVAEAGKP